MSCPSVRPTLFCLRFSDQTWHVGRGRWVIHSHTSLTPIRGQGQGHGLSEIQKSVIFENLSPPPIEVKSGYYLWESTLEDNQKFLSESSFDIGPSSATTWPRSWPTLTSILFRVRSSWNSVGILYSMNLTRKCISFPDPRSRSRSRT